MDGRQSNVDIWINDWALNENLFTLVSRPKLFDALMTLKRIESSALRVNTCYRVTAPPPRPNVVQKQYHKHLPNPDRPNPPSLKR